MYDDSRHIVARGLTASNKGAKIRYTHPVWGDEKEGVVGVVAYDPFQGQTLITFVDGAKVALDDLSPIRVLDNSTKNWPS